MSDRNDADARIITELIGALDALVWNCTPHNQKDQLRAIEVLDTARKHVEGVKE